MKYYIKMNHYSHAGFKLTNTEKTDIEEFVKGLDSPTTSHFLSSKEDIDGIVEVIRSNTSLIDLPLQKTILIHNQVRCPSMRFLLFEGYSRVNQGKPQCFVFFNLRSQAFYAQTFVKVIC